MNAPWFVREKNILELIYLASGKIRLYFYQSSQTGPLRNREGTGVAIEKIKRGVTKINEGLVESFLKERIEILKEKIREKLLQRTPKGKAAIKDIARPFVIVVFNIFDEKKSAPPGWAADILTSLTKKVIIDFAQDPQLELGERERLDKLLEEMDLDLSVLPWSNPDSLSLFGKFLYARAMLFLDVCKESEGIFLYYRLVDVETGVVKYAGDDIELAKEASAGDLAEKVYQRVQNVIYDTYIYPNQTLMPLRGTTKDEKGREGEFYIRSR